MSYLSSKGLACRSSCISADGTPRKWNRLVPITKDLAGLPTIRVDGHNLLLDEVVCWAFHGRPKPHIRAVTVVHFDDDPLNCAASNVAWRIDLEWQARQRYLDTLRTMPLVITKNPPRSLHPSRRILYFGA
jgi:hypothetical protein